LAGVSFALVTEKLREKGIERNAIVKQTILRGAEIFGMGLLFRVQEFALGYPWSPWTDLLRVDVLNILGLSMMLMGVLCWVTGEGAVAAARLRTLAAGILAAAMVALVTPPLWTTYRQVSCPGQSSPTSTAYTFLRSRSRGFFRCSRGRRLRSRARGGIFSVFGFCPAEGGFAFAALGGTGSSLAACRSYLIRRACGCMRFMTTGTAIRISAHPLRLFADHSLLVYAWCRWGFAQRGFSPIIQLGILHCWCMGTH